MPSDALNFRPATRGDLERIVHLLADDPLGRTRESVTVPISPQYERAFEAISADANNELIVAEHGGAVVGVLQLTVIPYLTHQGSSRALIEGVRVAADARSLGIGRQLVGFSVERARARGCSIVQLTTDKSRPDALRFYESLGFVASHEGLKLRL